MRVSELNDKLPAVERLGEAFYYTYRYPCRRLPSQLAARARRLYLHWWAWSLRVEAYHQGYNAGHLDGWSEVEYELGCGH